MNSCLYVGQVRHRRFTPRSHAFRYRLFLVYLDLEELPHLFKRFWLWSAKRPALAWFRRADHVGPAERPLAEVIRDHVEQTTGSRPQGAVRLLTHLRYFGMCFNPVSFYYCFDKEDQVEAIVCEVNNTPWGERHLYVLDKSLQVADGQLLRYQRGKAFHVSPFMPMDIDYDWRFTLPGERLNVHMENYRQDERIFDATLSLRQQPMTSRSLAGVLLMYPLVTIKVVAGIYYEALRLWLKKTPVYPHPVDKDATEEARGL